MTNVAALNFRKELAEAEAIAAQKKAEYDAIPEISADEILSAFRRELRSAAVPGFGTVYFFYPLSMAEHYAAKDKVAEDGSLSARGLVEVLVGIVRKSDGELKFGADHVDALLQAPSVAVLRLAAAVMPDHGFSVKSAEKK